MTTRLFVIGIIAAALIVAFVLSFVRRNRLAEEYSSIWIGTSVVIVLASVFSRHIVQAYTFLKGDAGGGPEILVVLAVAYLLVLLMLVSVRLSDSTRAITRLTQELGILRNEMGSLARKVEEAGHGREIGTVRES